MQITIAPTWSWPGADPAMLDALREGALKGLRSVPASAGEVVSAEFLGRSSTIMGSGGGTRHSSPDPVLRAVVRAPEGERTVEVLVDPGPLGADTPEEAYQYVSSVVYRTIAGDRPPEATPDAADPDSLASGWGYDVMREMAQVGSDTVPLMAPAAIRAGVRELYGDSAVQHERTGRPTGRELAEGFRDLRREAKRAGIDFAAVVSEEVEPVHIQRLNRILEVALEQQAAERALQTPEPIE